MVRFWTLLTISREIVWTWRLTRAFDGLVAQLRMVGKVVDGYRWGVAGPSQMAPGCDWAVSSRGDLIRRPRLKPVRQVQCLCAIM